MFSLADKLAIKGGKPVRTEPWPPMYPGGMLYGIEEIAAASEVIKAKSPYRHYGVDLRKKVEQFELEYAKYLGVRYAVAIGSGSTALTTAMTALGVGPGTEVIVPSFLWVSDINSVVLLRAIPIIADIDETLNLDPKLLEKKITPRTKLIVAIHMAGSAADIDPILEIGRKHSIPVLEDCSQAVGTTIVRKPIGSFGTISIASLQLNKNITSGEGGIIATNDETLYKKCLCIQDIGFERGEDGVSKASFSIYETFGLGCRMDEIRGAIALVQLNKLSYIVKAMRTRQREIWSALKGIQKIIPRRLVDSEGDCGAFLSWFHQDAKTAKVFGETLRAEGIPANPPHGGVHQTRNIPTLINKTSVTTEGCPWNCPHNQSSEMDYRPEKTSTSNDLLDRNLMIPLPTIMTDKDQEDLITAFRKTAEVLFGF